MTRRALSFVVPLLALGFAAGAGCSKSAPRPPRPPRPNVIFILLDTLRSDRLSSYGYGKPTTPNLDAFAKSGVLFEQVSVQLRIAAHLGAFEPRGLDEMVRGLRLIGEVQGEVDWERLIDRAFLPEDLRS